MEDERRFACLTFWFEMNLRMVMISILKNSRSEMRSAVERTSSKIKLSYSNHILTNRCP